MAGSCWANDSGMSPKLKECVKENSVALRDDYDRCLLQDCGGRRCPDEICFYGDPNGEYRKHPMNEPRKRPRKGNRERAARLGRAPFALAAPHHARRIPRRPRRR